MTELFIKRFKKLESDTEEIFLEMKSDDFCQITIGEKSVADLMSDFRAKLFEFSSSDFAELDVNQKSGVHTKDFVAKDKLVKKWNQSWAEFDSNLRKLKFGQNENVLIFEQLLILLSDCSVIYGQMILVHAKYISKDLQPELLNEQQNSSPVCFAKSDEIRDDYRI